jgi:hypothetical protein
MEENNFGFVPADEVKEEKNKFGFVPSDAQKTAVADYITAPEKVGQSEALVRGFGAGGSFDFGDELMGAVGGVMALPAETKMAMQELEHPEAMIETAPGMGQMQPKSFDQLYAEYRDLARQGNKEAMQDNPGAFITGAIGGGFALPGNILGATNLAKTAPIAQKALASSKLGAKAGAIAGAGMSEANPVFNPGEFTGDVVDSTAMGTVMGAGLPYAAQGAKSAVSGVKNVGKDVSDMLLEYYRLHKSLGREGINTLKKSGQDIINNRAAQYANQIPTQIIQELNEQAQLQKSLPRLAKETYQGRADINEINEALLPVQEGVPLVNRPEVNREMADLQELVTTAQQGPEVRQSKRVFFGEGPSKIQKFDDKFDDLKQVEGSTKLEPIVPQDKAKMEQLAQQKRVEQEMFPESYSQEPIEYVEQPLPGSDKVVAGVGQRVAQEAAEEGAEAAEPGLRKIAAKTINVEPQDVNAQPWEKILEPTDNANEVIGYYRRPVLDEVGQQIGWQKTSPKRIPLEEAAKFKDISETVRLGGRDLADLEELFAFYNDLKTRNRFGKNSYETPEVRRKADQLAIRIQEILRKNTVGLAETDAKIASLKGGAELLGFETQGTNINTQGKPPIGQLLDNMLQNPGSSQNASAQSSVQQQLRDKVMNLIMNKEGNDPTAQNHIQDFIDKVRPQYPELAAEFETAMNKFGKETKALNTSPSLAQWALAKKGSGYIGNIQGRAEVEIGRMTPDVIKNIAAKLAGVPSKGAQSVSKILAQLPDKSERERNAILFGLMQNPAYRKWISEAEEPAK